MPAMRIEGEMRFGTQFQVIGEFHVPVFGLRSKNSIEMVERLARRAAHSKSMQSSVAYSCGRPSRS